MLFKIGDCVRLKNTDLGYSPLNLYVRAFDSDEKTYQLNIKQFRADSLDPRFVQLAADGMRTCSGRWMATTTGMCQKTGWNLSPNSARNRR